MAETITRQLREPFVESAGLGITDRGLSLLKTPIPTATYTGRQFVQDQSALEQQAATAAAGAAASGAAGPVAQPWLQDASQPSPLVQRLMAKLQKQKEEFNEIKLKLAELSTKFSNNVLDSIKEFELYINEEYYGLYVSVEHIDDSFIDRNYADDSGNLWKCIWPADLTYRGDDEENYHPYWGDDRPYELKTNKEIYDYSKPVSYTHLTLPTKA